MLQCQMLIFFSNKIGQFKKNCLYTILSYLNTVEPQLPGVMVGRWCTVLHYNLC